MSTSKLLLHYSPIQKDSFLFSHTTYKAHTLSDNLGTPLAIRHYKMLEAVAVAFAATIPAGSVLLAACPIDEENVQEKEKATASASPIIPLRSTHTLFSSCFRTSLISKNIYNSLLHKTGRSFKDWKNNSLCMRR